MNKEILKAIKDFQIFLGEDMYSMFRPEIKMKNEVWMRDGFFRNKDDFIKYLNEHFEIFKDDLINSSEAKQ